MLSKWRLFNFIDLCTFFSKKVREIEGWVARLAQVPQISELMLLSAHYVSSSKVDIIVCLFIFSSLHLCLFVYLFFILHRFALERNFSQQELSQPASHNFVYFIFQVMLSTTHECWLYMWTCKIKLPLIYRERATSTALQWRKCAL